MTPARKPPKSVPYWWLGVKGKRQTYPVMGWCETGQTPPAEAKWWAAVGAKAWTRIPVLGRACPGEAT